MNPLRYVFDQLEPHFEKGGKLERLYPIYEVIDCFFFTPKDVTYGTCHVRDALDFKRMMTVVLVALIPCVFMACYNSGLQANQAVTQMGLDHMPGWRGTLLSMVGISHNAGSLFDNLAYGALCFFPAYIVCMVVGIGWEMIFAVVRKHEINEGFFVTGLLFPLTLPPTIPLWQVALGISFGVVLGKEVFGGTGRNFLNPALTGRAFLFFAYPTAISGDAVWTAVDGFSGATPLSVAASKGMEAVAAQVSYFDAFLGTMQGSMGETSTLACLLGAVVMLLAGVGSWRIMLSMLLGALGIASLFFLLGSDTNPMFQMPPHWHLVLGGLAFGLVFMATDPVSAAMTNLGQYIYGVLIGGMVILVRVLNPGFPEGTMLAILFGNVCAPLIDFYVVRANIKRRALRHA